VKQNVYTGTYNGTRPLQREWQVELNGHPFDPTPSQAVYNHSPDGFAWGYGGSGPAQLALAILLEETGDAERAFLAHQTFKFQVVAKWEQSGSWTLTSADVAAWFARQ